MPECETIVEIVNKIVSDKFQGNVTTIDVPAFLVFLHREGVLAPGIELLTRRMDMLSFGKNVEK